jgi:hypothetical protein
VVVVPGWAGVPGGAVVVLPGVPGAEVRPPGAGDPVVGPLAGPLPASAGVPAAAACPAAAGWPAAEGSPGTAAGAEAAPLGEAASTAA